MLFLNSDDIIRSVDLNSIMDQIEKAYKIFGSGEFYMPPRPTVTYGNQTLIYMPCFTEQSMGTKMLTIFPDNAKLGLPSIDGLVILNDRETGKPTAILDGQAVTAYRTGAVGGVAIRHLAKKDAHTVGIVGAGTQGFHLALYACAARKIDTVYVYNHSDRDLKKYLEKLRKYIADSTVKVVQCKQVEELIKCSDIICTATPAEKPVLPEDKELLRGKCIVAVGSYKPEMREIPDVIFELVDAVYTELEYACEESGDLSQPLESGLLDMSRVKLMHELLESGKDADEQVKETTYFKSVGMGLFDLCVATELAANATVKKIGQNIRV